MSMYLPNSEVSRVNTAAGRGAVPVSEETFRLLQRAAEFADLGRGAFDPTIGPLVNLWNIGSGEESVPETGELKEALELVNYRKLRFEEKGLKVFLEKTGMSLDLGGIAKGHAADRMVDYLRGKGAPAGIVNLGGNVYAFGKKPTGGPWKIGIQSPYDNRGVYMGIVEIDEGVVVTSGKYERFFIENGVRYHHILSTIDGFPIENGLASVTILSSDATAADALSTLVFALGLEEGLKLTETLEGVEGIFITEEKTVFTTPGLRDSFKLTDEEFRWGESKDLPVK
jgi:thiamine biosynthesis lipoprotein